MKTNDFKYKTFEEFEKKCEEFLDLANKDNETPITKVAIAAYLKIDRHTINNYKERGEEWKKYIDYLTMLCENDLTNNGLTGNYNPTMAIFLLKVNHNKVEKQHIETSGTNFIEDMLKDIKGE